MKINKCPPIGLLVVLMSSFLSCNSSSGSELSLHDLLTKPPRDEVILIIEDSDDLPYRDSRDDTGVILEQVDLDKGKAVSRGFNPIYLTGWRLYDGDLMDPKKLSARRTVSLFFGGIGNQITGGVHDFEDGASRISFEIYAAPAPNDYVIEYYKNDGDRIENICYLQNAPVYRLKPGVINYISKQRQPKLFFSSPDGGNVTGTVPADLVKTLSKYATSELKYEDATVEAVIRFDPDKINQALGDRCRYKDTFHILQRVSGRPIP